MKKKQSNKVAPTPVEIGSSSDDDMVSDICFLVLVSILAKVKANCKLTSKRANVNHRNFNMRVGTA